MVLRGHDPAWPDKAMFSAILLVLSGFVGGVFELTRPLLDLDQDRLPTLFTDELPFYTLTMCVATLTLGLWSLQRQAALPAYAGVVTAMLSLGVFGLVPALALVAAAFMLASHAEGEETHLDDRRVEASQWPDKAMAASLLLVVVAGIAATQAVLILADRFAPLVLADAPAAAGLLGLAVAAWCLVAARSVYRLDRPWLAWTGFAFGLATLGFYLVGPLMALAGMVLLWRAHAEHEFGTDAPAGPAAPQDVRARRKGRRSAT